MVGRLLDRSSSASIRAWLFLGDEQSQGGCVVGVTRGVCLDDRVGTVAALSRLELPQAPCDRRMQLALRDQSGSGSVARRAARSAKSAHLVSDVLIRKGSEEL
ncbi:hypothetical protein Rwratislav_26819 [Rhodococcus wratislaviensis IFP 2016]|uniref:Uncharacterized protein n=1 Tax=Rhodococcus opacus M213 TaxID=1129896 RepID=K8X7L6_RHOOP|nr:hypothetical protein WSS_A37502 [Rhodococcus opacus M213]ELB89955.1 hypothetical protein Rwratislav_26819 [Rhodococcus wratislaviensis IFP 2016]